jgi:hypothetical protein
MHPLFDEFLRQTEGTHPSTWQAWKAGYAAGRQVRPQRLTPEEIRECWRDCNHLAPMTFAEALQTRLGLPVEEKEAEHG